MTFEVTDSPQAVPSSGPASMAEPHIIRTALMDYDTVMIGLSTASAAELSSWINPAHGRRLSECLA